MYGTLKENFCTKIRKLGSPFCTNKKSRLKSYNGISVHQILQVQQIEPPVGLTGVHQGTDIGGPEGPIESGATAAAGPSNQAHAEQKEERQLRRQPGPAKGEEFKVAKSPILTGGVLEGDDGGEKATVERTNKLFKCILYSREKYLRLKKVSTA